MDAGERWRMCQMAGEYSWKCQYYISLLQRVQYSAVSDTNCSSASFLAVLGMEPPVHAVPLSSIYAPTKFSVIV